jgi:hypothetical protein
MCRQDIASNLHAGTHRISQPESGPQRRVRGLSRPALDRIEQHSSAPAIESGFGMHRAARCWIMLFFLASSPFWHVTHIGPATVHVCVRTTRSNQKRYNSKTPQARLRFMFHYRIPPYRRLINGAPPDTPALQAPDRLRRKNTIKDDSPRPPRPDTPIRLYSLLFVLLSSTPQVTPFLHDPICNRSGCMRNPFRGGVSP